MLLEEILSFHERIELFHNYMLNEETRTNINNETVYTEMHLVYFY